MSPTPTPARPSPPAPARPRGVPLSKRIKRRLGWALFVGGGLLTPRLAARRAAKLWCKLPDNQGRRKDNRTTPGQVSQVEVGLTSPLTVETWCEAGPLVYLVHGWGGWRGQVAAFVDPLVEAGYQVIAFDSLSHGDAGPGRHGPGYSSGGEMIDSLEALAAIYGPARGVIAHSLGCATVCRAILESKVHSERLTLVSPNQDMRLYARDFARRLGFGAKTTRLLIEEMELWAKRSMGGFDVAEMGATGLLPDALVIHDAADKEASYTVAQEIDQAWPGARLMTTHGLGHHRILIDPAVVAAATGNIIEPKPN